VRRGDTLILCSDGLSGQMRAEDIGRIRERGRRPDAGVQGAHRPRERERRARQHPVVAVRFEGSGLALASDGEGVGHQSYTSQTERRITQPVDASSIPLEDEITEPIPAGRRRVWALATARSGGSAKARRVGPRRRARRHRRARRRRWPRKARHPHAIGGGRWHGAGGGRIPVAQLRLIFGTIAFVIGVAVLYSLFRK